MARRVENFNSIYGLLTESVGRAKSRFQRLADFGGQGVRSETEESHARVMLQKNKLESLIREYVKDT